VADLRTEKGPTFLLAHERGGGKSVPLRLKRKKRERFVLFVDQGRKRRRTDPKCGGGRPRSERKKERGPDLKEGEGKTVPVGTYGVRELRVCPISPRKEKGGVGARRRLKKKSRKGKERRGKRSYLSDREKEERNSLYGKKGGGKPAPSKSNRGRSPLAFSF